MRSATKNIEHKSNTGVRGKRTWQGRRERNKPTKNIEDKAND